MAASGSGAVFYEDVDEEYRVRERILNPTGENAYVPKKFEDLLPAEKTFDQNPLQNWVRTARMNAIDWIIKTREQFNFKFHTAYLSTTYVDRCLSKGMLIEDQIQNQWVVPLLSVACLSLAANMEESGNVDLSGISFGDYSFILSNIHLMELIVMNTLDWMMNSVTPFDFIRFFVPKCRKQRRKKDVVVATVEAIFTTVKDRDFMRCLPSVIAIAATLFAVDRTLTRQSLEIRMNEISLIESFVIDDVYACYERILQLQPTTSPDESTIFQPPSATRLTTACKRRLTFSNDDQHNPEKRSRY